MVGDASVGKHSGRSTRLLRPPWQLRSIKERPGAKATSIASLCSGAWKAPAPSEMLRGKPVFRGLEGPCSFRNAPGQACVQGPGRPLLPPKCSGASPGSGAWKAPAPSEMLRGKPGFRGLGRPLLPPKCSGARITTNPPTCVRMAALGGGEGRVLPARLPDGRAGWAMRKQRPIYDHQRQPQILRCAQNDSAF
jgi:hypothetical protein